VYGTVQFCLETITIRYLTIWCNISPTNVKPRPSFLRLQH